MALGNVGQSLAHRYQVSGLEDTSSRRGEDVGALRAKGIRMDSLEWIFGILHDSKKLFMLVMLMCSQVWELLSQMVEWRLDRNYQKADLP